MTMASLSKMGAYYGAPAIYTSTGYEHAILFLGASCIVLAFLLLFIIYINRRKPIYVNKVHQLATISREYDGSAGWDLSCVELVEIKSGFYCINTGISVEIPSGEFGLLCFRSGVARRMNEAYGLSAQVGIIDSDYRGEIKYYFRLNGAPALPEVMSKLGSEPLQIIFTKMNPLDVVFVKELNNSIRGKQGFNS